MALDEKRGLVFVPTGSAAFDFYGANRIGNDLYANCLLALEATTGRRVWSYQFVHHDLWDRDLPAPPTLVTLKHDGKRPDAVAQVTKSGHVFIFERETGKPVFPVVEKPVPQSDVSGEQTSATQPVPLQPPPFTRQALTEETLTSRTPEAHEAVRARFCRLRSRGQFVPPSLQGTVIFPGTDGGAEWGGPAFDPQSSILCVNANEMPFVIRLVERVRVKSGTGSQLYQQNCSGCHRPGVGVTILDCACEIGTQSLGLAKLGFCVTTHQLPEERFSRKLRTLRISHVKRASNVYGRKESHTNLIGPNQFLENGSSNWTNERLTS